MNKVEIPMMNFQIGQCILGWTPVLYGGVPHWKIEKGENNPKRYIPISGTPNFKENFEEIEKFLLPVFHEKKFEVFMSIQKEKTVCILVSMTERYDAVAETPTLAIALASLKLVGIEVEDLDETWIELYPAS